MKTIVIGVMSQEQIRARAIAIAKGEYKPRPDEPKIWFTSINMNLQPMTPNPPSNNTYIVVITQDNEQARLTCNSMEEAVQARQAFINYGKCQDVTIEKA